MLQIILSLSLITILSSCGQNKDLMVTNEINSKINEENLLKIKALNQKSNFKIALLSNIIEDIGSLQSSIDFINNSKYDFVIVNGNISNNGFKYEFEEVITILNRLNVPYLTVAGDKDLGSGGLDLYRTIFGSENYTLNINNKAFIFYNNNNWETQIDAPNVSWIEEQLKAYRGSEIYLISNCSFKNVSRFSDAQIQKVESIITKYKVKYVLNNSDSDKSFNQFEELAVDSISTGSILEIDIADTKSSHRYVNYKSI